MPVKLDQEGNAPLELLLDAPGYADEEEEEEEVFIEVDDPAMEREEGKEASYNGESVGETRAR